MDSFKLKGNRAFTTIDIIFTTLIAVMMFSLVFPAAKHIINELQTKNIISEIEEIAGKIDEFYLDNLRYPDLLSEIYTTVPIDPWGNPYQYLNIRNAVGNINGIKRKSKSLKQINSDYDLYSMGPDGESVSPLTANVSKDDIVRGSNGSFFGLTADY